ncbi:hypothetical protein K7432_009843 [Basidiobolus ranarum]|uniref:Prolactin receptor n=1 Tax=Basidiobolus ranarum TaxID=34480 RepID=A0ABR2VX82_9FUNG
MSGLSIWFNPSKPNHYGQLPNTPVLNGPNLSSCADKRRSRENTMYTCSSLTGSYWLPETLHKRNYSCDSVASSNDFSNANSSDSEDFKSSWTHEAPTEHSKSDPPPFNANLHTPERDVSHVLKGSELHLDSPSDISYEGIPSNFNQIKKSDIPAVLDRDLRKSNLYKTEFCRSYEETGFCR